MKLATKINRHYNKNNRINTYEHIGYCLYAIYFHIGAWKLLFILVSSQSSACECRIIGDEIITDINFAIFYRCGKYQ